MTIDGPIITSQISERSHRVSFQKCDGYIANFKPTLDMVVVNPMTLAGPEATFKYEPAFHIFYGERVMDVIDGLPKFDDLPEPFGGSGKTATAPASSGWH